MSTWTEITIDDYLTIYPTQNSYHLWFFQEGDRVREVHTADEDLRYDGAFIGYRASVGQIKRSMELYGYDRDSLERHFSHALNSWKTELGEEFYALEGIQDKEEYDTRRYNWLKLALGALENARLEDWIQRFKQAKDWPRNDDFHFSVYEWVETDDPVLSLMLSSVDEYCEWVHNSSYNFPCIDYDFYSFALLLASDDNALCELNLSELIWDERMDDFLDLEERNCGATKPLRNARKSLDELLNLANQSTENSVLLRMCYSGIITVMEVYLSDIFCRSVEHESVKRRFVENYAKYKSVEKKPLSEVYKQLESLDKIIEDDLQSLSFHHIPTVKQLYDNCLLIRFPEHLLSGIAQAVQIRHDIVHRNGRDVKGMHHEISIKHLKNLNAKMNNFLNFIDQQVLDALEKLFIDAQHDENKQ